ncbi:serine/threonine-protein kinase [Endozoicomonas atrinae]|uniref:serine/threonine-protein kinase n=1 Tax=Endozoicomonas atrinae TaxID=1333660 RepID=UPI000826DE0C|nr:serine/threonine-protein kinase [Endozoicomonas atrinae]
MPLGPSPGNIDFAKGIDPQIWKIINPDSYKPAKQKIKANGRGRKVWVMEPNAALAKNANINKHVKLPLAKPIHQRQIKKALRFGLPVAKPESIKFIKKLGNGAFGQVYMVENKAHERFALKMVGSNPELRHECAVLLKLSRSGPHKNLINVIGVSPGRSKDKYMLMELGGSSLLKDLKRGNMKDDELCDSFFQILMGASAIEQAGLQHNDLKPENILIDNKGCLKICDFGLAKRKDELTSSGTVLYMSPEKLGIIKSSYPDRSDSWALGCIFAEMRLGYPIMDKLFPKSSSKPTLASIKKVLKKTYNKILDKEGFEAADLFAKLTIIDPYKRISPSEALKHSYFQG